PAPLPREPRDRAFIVVEVARVSGVAFERVDIVAERLGDVAVYGRRELEDAHHPAGAAVERVAGVVELAEARLAFGYGDHHRDVGKVCANKSLDVVAVERIYGRGGSRTCG